MLDFFTNPGYLAAGGALVSSPIIIHLINRMRFKRLRWAAMEFLLKSQKRNRRRLIIEQLLLLMLRCLLVVLTALLVLRFIGFSLAGFVNQDSLHVILLDDTLSMNDRHKEGNDFKTAFKVAKQEAILNNIVKSLGQSTTNERVAIIPLSKLVTDAEYEPVVYQHLNDGSTENAIKAALDEMPPTNLRVDLLKGVDRARKLLADHRVEARPVLHIVSDFRKVDWSGSEAEGLLKTLREMADSGIKVHLNDAAHPYRVSGQGGVPLSHDNLGIVDLRPNTRVVGKGVPVTFTVTVANHGTRDENVNVVIYDEGTGKELPQIDFNPPMPLKVRPADNVSASFELRLYPDIKPTEMFHAQRISARLESASRVALENDGLAADNVRYAAVEVRNKVPLLVIDGQGSRGREENNDSFFLEKAIMSIPGASYEIVYGHDLTGKEATTALERADLRQYPSIFLLNVRELSPVQVRNLEKYVREGGGVGFFLGPNVSAAAYNKALYKDGAGIFPAPLRTPFYPPPNAEPLKPVYTGDAQLRLRPDQFGGVLDKLPIFGPMFPEGKGQDLLTDLPIKRYFQVPRAEWRLEPGRVFELATLPNDEPINNYQAAAVAILDKLDKVLAENGEYTLYALGLERYNKAIRAVVAPGSEQKPARLARVLEALLTDQGRKATPDFPNLTEFWATRDPKIDTLKAEVELLRKLALYGDPFVVAQRFGKGKVVAVMSTAGKEWNDWGGGSNGSILYQPFLWELQNYLSSQGSESDYTLGSTTEVSVELARFKQQGKDRLKVVRTFYKPVEGEPAVPKVEAPTFGTEREGQMVFSFPRTFESGFYLSQLFAQDDSELRTPLAAWHHVYNVDAEHEGKLARVSHEDLDQNLLHGRSIDIRSIHTDPDDLVNRQSDLSESPWFFLLFLGILVAEQALAVHLSFHLKGSEGEMPHAVNPQAKAA